MNSRGILLIILIVLVLTSCTKVSERINDNEKNTTGYEERSIEERLSIIENSALKKKEETAEYIKSDVQAAKDSVKEAVDYICEHGQNTDDEEIALNLVYYSAYLSDLSLIPIDKKNGKTIETEYSDNAVVKLAKLSHNYYTDYVLGNKAGGEESDELVQIINDTKNNYEEDLEEFINILISIV